MLNLKLHDYQIAALNFIKSNPYCGIFLDMGYGKTLITLKAIYDLNPNYNVLIIAPKNIAKSTWLFEIKKWKIPLRIHSLIEDNNQKPYTKQQRWDLYKDIATRKQPALYLINRELLCDLINQLQKNNLPWLFPMVVIDEFQSFKSYKSQRFKALKKMRPQIYRLIGLTGTPAPNGLMDLWPQMYLLDQGQRLEPTITKYRNKYFIASKYINGYPVQWVPKTGAKQIIEQNINSLCFSVQNTTLKLPTLTTNDIPIYMTDKEYKVYDKLKTENILQVGSEEIIAQNAAVLTQKLAQLASGTIYTDDEHNFKILHYHKLEELDYIVNNTNSPILIAYYFKSDLTMIETFFKKQKIKYKVFDGNTQTINDWNNKKIPIMLIQPASAGHGLNLQDGGHTLVWYTLPWSLELYKQTNARLYRQGQTKPVIIHRLITQKTIDTRIIKLLEQKNITQNDLINAVMKSI